MAPIPLLNLTWMLVPLIAVGIVAQRWAGKGGEFGYATLRMILQLALIGYVLTFIFEQQSSLLGVGLLTFMLTVAAVIGTRTVNDGRGREFLLAFGSITVGGGTILGLVIFGVLALDPWYQPRFVIPLAGMIFANAMNAVSLCAERFETERNAGKTFPPARKSAFVASLIPQVNSFFAVGLVSIPGMMTGQILSQVSPLVAARYQVMVMCMVLGSAGLSVIVYLSLHAPRDEAPLSAADNEGV